MIITSIWFPNDFYDNAWHRRKLHLNCINLLYTHFMLSLSRTTKQIDDMNFYLIEVIYIETSQRI